MAFQLVNLALICGAVYGFAVIVKAAKRIIRVSDVYLAEKSRDR